MDNEKVYKIVVTKCRWFFLPVKIIMNYFGNEKVISENIGYNRFWPGTHFWNNWRWGEFAVENYWPRNAFAFKYKNLPIVDEVWGIRDDVGFGTAWFEVRVTLTSRPGAWFKFFYTRLCHTWLCQFKMSAIS